MNIEENRKIPLKYIAKVQKGKLPKKFAKKSDLDLPIYLSMDVMRGNLKGAKYVKDYESCVLAEDGDVLVLWDGSNAGEVMLAKEGVISSTVALLNVMSSEIDNRFFFYQLKSKEQLIKDSSVGMGIPHVNPQELSNFSFFIPSLLIQQKIVNYLDEQTTEIDQLIADKEGLLKLYAEEKTAVINDLVTGKKVWDGNSWTAPVEVKNSGIEWLGEVPEHWKVIKLKNTVSKVGSGITPRGGAEVYQTQGIPLLRSQNVYSDGLRMKDVAYISEKIHNSMINSKVLSGDVLLNITGGSIGRAMYIEEWLGEANVNQHVCIVRPLDGINTKFLYYILISQIGQEQIQFEQTGSGREGLNFEALKNFYLPLPSVEIQHSTVDYIETELEKIDTKIKNTKKLIDLLKEYRKALISEVVTGKVKVV